MYVLVTPECVRGVCLCACACTSPDHLTKTVCTCVHGRVASRCCQRQHLVCSSMCNQISVLVSVWMCLCMYLWDTCSHLVLVEPANRKVAGISLSLEREPGSLGRRKPQPWSCWRLHLLTTSLNTEKGQKRYCLKLWFCYSLRNFNLIKIHNRLFDRWRS